MAPKNVPGSLSGGIERRYENCNAPPEAPAVGALRENGSHGSKMDPTNFFFEFLVQNSIPLLIMGLRPSRSDHSKNYNYAKSQGPLMAPLVRKGLSWRHPQTLSWVCVGLPPTLIASPCQIWRKGCPKHQFLPIFGIFHFSSVQIWTK